MMRQSATMARTMPQVRSTEETSVLSALNSSRGFRAFEREVQLLLLSARRQLDDATGGAIKALLEAPIDWEFVLRKANEHGVTSLLCQSLNVIGSECVPDAVLTRLRKFTAENAHYNLYRTRELIKLLGLLESQGVSCFPFKGPVLSALVYHNLALREYGDLDVLIRRRDVLKTRDLLLEHGYHLWTRPTQTNKSPVLSHRSKDVIFESANGRIRVELHWQLSGSHFRFPLDMELLWEQLETVSLAGVRVRTLRVEDLLLYLCMHGSRHGWGRLLWICDIAEIVRQHSEIDWQRITEKARALGCERMLGLGLLLARDLLDAKLPEESWQKISVDESVKSLATQVGELLFTASNPSSAISYWNDLHLRVRERLSDRMRLRLYYYRRYLRLALVPNERDRAIVPLPHFLFSLYYVLRPLRLIKSFGRVTLKKLAKPFGYS